MLPLSEWIAQDWRMSARSGQSRWIFRLQELRTKVCERHDVDDAKMFCRLFAIELYVQLLSHGAMPAVATDYVFRAGDFVIEVVYWNRLVRTGFKLRMAIQLIPSCNSQRNFTFTG